MSNDKVTDFTSIKPGQTITLSDQGTLSTAMERGLGASPQDYEVVEVTTVIFARGLQYTLIDITNANENLLVVIKQTDGIFDLYVYFQPVDFDPGNRVDMYKYGTDFMFVEEDLGDDPDGLTYAEVIEVDGVDLTQKSPMSFTTNMTSTVFDDPLIVGIIEYNTAEEMDYQNMLITEFGELLCVYQGSGINAEEIEIL
jgi:hypothetical protein